MKKLTFEDLPMATQKILDKLELIEGVLRAPKPKTKEKDLDRLYTREEAANYFRISLPTLNNWSKSGILISYRLGNRVYYKQSEIESALVPTR
jgi:excisionase family DNA binding protein